MKLVMKAAVTGLMAALLVACTSQGYLDTQAEIGAIKKTMDAAVTKNDNSQVSRISKPPVNIEPLRDEVIIPWLEDPVSVKASGLPLSMVLSQVMDGTGISIWFDGDVDPNIPVTLSFQASRADVLNVMSRQTKYGFTPTPKRLEIRKFEAQTFNLPFPQGLQSGQLGSQGSVSASGGSGATGGSASTRIEGQYLNVSYDNVNITEEVGKAIRTILKDEGSDSDELVGSVQVVPSMSSISVRTTPDRMAQVRELVKTYTDELSKQVLLDVLVLEFRSNLGKERGIDWSIMKDVGEGSLQFFVPGTNTVSQGTGYGLAFQGSGKWDGTTAFIKALEKQGQVSTETPITTLMVNNQPGHISQTLTKPYMDEVKSEANDNVVTASVTRGRQQEGVDFMVTPNIQRDYVYLRIAGKLTKIIGERPETVHDVKIMLIDTRESEINFVNKLRYGQTVVIASVKQTSKTAEQSKNYGTQALGGEGTDTSTVETLVLLTPRRVQ
ncbi:type II secretion system protein GspD [Shewanella algae]|uniref:type II secretion system protein GspD n=2 Tax=Shewanella algae TaxID=38313 RepID=UPI0011826933|nr:hypothetical protein [Shewanella algae]MBO2558947.1 hypothetical protein [Shewanella algae]MBO2575900.1 hypothetical protein [Shewanella algae]TVO83392.1 hypothetical protein AYI80_19445 [Shewanella algae]TXS83019.1 hypothetical protein AYI81_20425 [Shewanella algae]